MATEALQTVQDVGTEAKNVAMSQGRAVLQIPDAMARGLGSDVRMADSLVPDAEDLRNLAKARARSPYATAITNKGIGIAEDVAFGAAAAYAAPISGGLLGIRILGQLGKQMLAQGTAGVVGNALLSEDGTRLQNAVVGGVSAAAAPAVGMLASKGYDTARSVFGTPKMIQKAAAEADRLGEVPGALKNMEAAQKQGTFLTPGEALGKADTSIQLPREARLPMGDNAREIGRGALEGRVTNINKTVQDYQGQLLNNNTRESFYTSTQELYTKAKANPTPVTAFDISDLRTNQHVIDAADKAGVALPQDTAPNLNQLFDIRTKLLDKADAVNQVLYGGKTGTFVKSDERAVAGALRKITNVIKSTGDESAIQALKNSQRLAVYDKLSEPLDKISGDVTASKLNNALFKNATGIKEFKGAMDVAGADPEAVNAFIRTTRAIANGKGPLNTAIKRAAPSIDIGKPKSWADVALANARSDVITEALTNNSFANELKKISIIKSARVMMQGLGNLLTKVAGSVAKQTAEPSNTSNTNTQQWDEFNKMYDDKLRQGGQQ
jgi:hypothetical protein